MSTNINFNVAYLSELSEHLMPSSRMSLGLTQRLIVCDMSLLHLCASERIFMHLADVLLETEKE